MEKFSRLIFCSALLGTLSIFIIISIDGQDSISMIAESKPNASSQKLEYEHLIQKLGDRHLSKLPIDKIVQTVSSQFLGATYREGLLDRSETEKLFVSLTEFDCVLFVETVLAFSRNLLSPSPTYNSFVQKVQEVRYVNGKLDGYCSRLHYFSEWVRDNQKRNIVENITTKLGGIPLKKTLNFMSNNWRKYSRLRHSEANYQCILAMERKIALEMQSAPLRYIPSPKIRSIYPMLKAGDIIAITTDIDGLDSTHTGLVYPTASGIGFIHASPSGRVTISPDLHLYVRGVDRAIGIMVARPTFKNN